MSAATQYSPADSMKITKVKEHIGAIVTGIDLAWPIDAATQKLLYAAAVENVVLVIRGQAHLTPAQVQAAGELFGELMEDQNRIYLVDGFPLISVLDNFHRDSKGQPAKPDNNATWHTDHTNQERPPKFTVLYAVAVPDKGGATSVCYAHAYQKGDLLIVDDRASLHKAGHDFDPNQHRRLYRHAGARRPVLLSRSDWARNSWSIELGAIEPKAWRSPSSVKNFWPSANLFGLRNMPRMTAPLGATASCMLPTGRQQNSPRPHAFVVLQQALEHVCLFNGGVLVRRHDGAGLKLEQCSRHSVVVGIKHLDLKRKRAPHLDLA